MTSSADGKQRTRFGTKHQDYDFALALHADGERVMAGSATLLVTPYEFALARYLAF